MSDKTERIKSLFERDRRQQRKAISAQDIPSSYEAITNQWLTAVLCVSHPGTEVVDFRLGEIDTGTSNRRRIFIEYNSAGSRAGLPRSVFCKAAHDLTNRLLLSSAATVSEVVFYTRVRPLLDLDAPTAYFAGYDPESWTAVIVLRDLAGQVQFCSHETSMDEARAQSQLGLLAKLHGKFHESPLLRADLAELPLFQARFRNLVENFSLAACCMKGVEEAQPVIPPSLFRRRDEIWAATIRAVDQFDDLPVTVIHGDVHLKNWYVRLNGGMGLADWQVCSRGHWSRDLAYAIATALTPEQRRSLERNLIRFYVDSLAKEGGPTVDFDTAFRLYREQMPSALAWWTMTLTPLRESMPDMQPRSTTLEFIRRISAAMDDLESMDAKV
jgi:hypothetical protein